MTYFGLNGRFLVGLRNRPLFAEVGDLICEAEPMADGQGSLIDGNRDEGDIRGLFGDAVARIRIRRLRQEAVA